MYTLSIFIDWASCLTTDTANCTVSLCSTYKLGPFHFYTLRHMTLYTYRWLNTSICRLSSHPDTLFLINTSVLIYTHIYIYLYIYIQFNNTSFWCSYIPKLCSPKLLVQNNHNTIILCNMLTTVHVDVTTKILQLLFTGACFVLVRSESSYTTHTYKPMYQWTVT